tara:strand:- start:550 stop:861 length:312 start_codon:yes stop_codon:yes gene_type:complete
MAVETATELAIFFEANDFAVTASYTPQGGSSTNILGIYDQEYLELDSGGSVAFAINQPRFQCDTASVPSAAEGDTLVVSGINYKIVVVQPDGTGVTTLVLEKQ